MITSPDRQTFREAVALWPLGQGHLAPDRQWSHRECDRVGLGA